MSGVVIALAVVGGLVVVVVVGLTLTTSMVNRDIRRVQAEHGLTDEEAERFARLLPDYGQQMDSMLPPVMEGWSPRTRRRKIRESAREQAIKDILAARTEQT